MIEGKEGWRLGPYRHPGTVSASLFLAQGYLISTHIFFGKENSARAFMHCFPPATEFSSLCSKTVCGHEKVKLDSIELSVQKIF